MNQTRLIFSIIFIFTINLHFNNFNLSYKLFDEIFKNNCYKKLNPLIFKVNVIKYIYMKEYHYNIFV